MQSQHSEGLIYFYAVQAKVRHASLPGIVHQAANLSKALIGTVEELSASTQTMNLVRDQFEINYFGPLNIIKAVLPYMRRERSGHVMILSGISRICVLSNNEGLVLT